MEESTLDFSDAGDEKYDWKSGAGVVITVAAKEKEEGGRCGSWGWGKPNPKAGGEDDDDDEPLLLSTEDEEDEGSDWGFEASGTGGTKADILLLGGGWAESSSEDEEVGGVVEEADSECWSSVVMRSSKANTFTTCDDL